MEKNMQQITQTGDIAFQRHALTPTPPERPPIRQPNPQVRSNWSYELPGCEHVTLWIIFKDYYFLAIFAFIGEGKPKTGEREREWHAAKGPGLESNQVRCDEDSALMVHALPVGPPGLPTLQDF